MRLSYMRWPYKLRLRLRSILRRSRVEEELSAELQFHLERQAEENRLRGMDSSEARLAALRAFDGVEQRKEECRDRRRVVIFDQLAQDLRYAARTLRKKPVFTAAAVVSLALGIGVNTAVFSLLNTLLLTKLPIRDPDNIYQLMVQRRTMTANSFSYANYRRLQNDVPLFDSVTIWDQTDFNFEADQSKIQVHGALVAGNFFEFMKVRAAAGRLIEPSDDTAAGASAAVLGYGFWRRQFHADPDIIGKTVQIERTPFTIVGVAEAGFGGAEIGYPQDVFVPVHAILRYSPGPGAITLDNPGSYAFRAMVRLNPGITMQAAGPVLRDLWPRLDEGEAPMKGDNFRPKLEISSGAFGASGWTEYSRSLIVVMVLVALVLLIMCANLASLLLARALGRKKEIAVRLAIGANRWRLIRQSLTEALLLAVLGGVVGLLLAGSLTRALLLFLPSGESGFLAFHLDGRLAGFAAAASIATALLFGLLPAFQSVRVPLVVAMSESGRSEGLARRSWLTRAVVALQVSVSVVLVVGSLLFARSLQNVSRADLGFRRDNLYQLALDPAREGLRGQQNDLLYKRIIEELNATPGVVASGVSRMIPLSGGLWWDTVVVSGHSVAPNEVATVFLNQVSPAYFQTFGIPVVQGRAFTAADDRTEDQRVAIVNQSFVRHFFDGRDPLGRVVNLGYGLAFPDNPRYAAFRNLRIVGVVADSKYQDPRETQKDLVYLAMYQTRQDISGVISVRFKPGVTQTGAQGQVRALTNRLAAGLDVKINPYDDVLRSALQRDRMVTLLSAIFGLLGLALACVGLYGVISQSVAARTSEIGIRMTLGARAGEVQRMVLGEALLLIALGLLTGVPLALGALKIVRGWLFGVRIYDPQVLLCSMLLMGLVGVASAWLPARRASRIDPCAALRSE